MKSKLKKAAALDGMPANAYTMKLKTDLATLQTLPSEEKPPLFVLRTDYEFPDGASTLFIVGLSSDWKKHIKQNGWLKGSEAKQTAFGTCQRKGDDMHVVLQKGKLTTANFKKAIKQNAALKKLNWHIVEQLTDDENDDFLNEEDADDAPTTQGKPAPPTNEADKAKANSINNALIKLVKATQAAQDPAEKKKLLLEIDALADQLYAIPSWEDYTPDELEAVLAKIEAMLAKQNASDNNQDKALAEQLYKQILALVPPIQQATNATTKQTLLAQLDTLARQLYAVPDWRDYTPDNIEKMLEQRQQATPNKQAPQADAAAHTAAQEAKHWQDASQKIEELYNSLDESFIFDKLPQTLTDLQHLLAAWQEFDMAISKDPQQAHALNYSQALQAQLQEVQQIQQQHDAIRVDLAAFREAIKGKNQAEALRLQQQILDKLA